MRFLCDNLRAKKIIFEYKLRHLMARVRYLLNTYSPIFISNMLFYDDFLAKGTVFLRESCQIVQPLTGDQIPKEAKDNNYGLSTPGNIQAYLQVVDLMASKLRYVSTHIL